MEDEIPLRQRLRTGDHRIVALQIAQILEGQVIMETHQPVFFAYQLSANRTQHMLVFHQAGMGRAIRVGERVHAEAAVMRPFAEIAAISIEFLSVFFLHQAVIRPFPDAAAHKFRMGIKRLPIVLQIARALAHGMGVFTLEKGLLRLLLHKLLHPFQIGIHSAEHIRRFGMLIPLIMDRPGSVDGAHGGGHGHMIAAIAGFIAQRPHGDAGMIPIPLHHPHAPGHKLLFPNRLLGDEIIGFKAHHAVAFNIRFVDHIQAVFIAQGQEAGIVGIMAGADAVDIVLLHQQNVPEHFADRRIVAQGGVGVVAVHALELNGLTVEIVYSAQNFHFAESDELPFGLAVNLRQPFIAVGGFGRPRLHVFHRASEHRFAVFYRHGCSGDGMIPVQQRKSDLRRAFHLRPELKRAVPVFMNQIRLGHHIADSFFAKGEQRHVPEQTAEPPHILILQIRAVGPLQHHHPQMIGAAMHIVRHVEFRRKMGALGKADQYTVHIGIIAGAHAIEAQQSFPAFKRCGQHKFPVVYANRGVIRHEGRIIGDGETHIGILGSAITLQLPYAGHVNLSLPAFARFAGQFGHICGSSIIGEIPAPIQGTEIGRRGPLARFRCGGIRVGNNRGAHRQPEQIRAVQILKFGSHQFFLHSHHQRDEAYFMFFPCIVYHSFPDLHRKNFEERRGESML